MTILVTPLLKMLHIPSSLLLVSTPHPGERLVRVSDMSTRLSHLVTLVDAVISTVVKRKVEESSSYFRHTTLELSWPTDIRSSTSINAFKNNYSKCKKEDYVGLDRFSIFTTCCSHYFLFHLFLLCQLAFNFSAFLKCVYYLIIIKGYGGYYCKLRL